MPLCVWALEHEDIILLSARCSHCSHYWFGREILGCFEEQMCKSLVMENTAFDPAQAGPNESR